MSNYEITREELNVPAGEVAFVEKMNDRYWQIYHRIDGVGIWGTAVETNLRSVAVARLEKAIADGEARKVAEMAAVVAA